MVERCISYWNSLFLGDMLVFRGVSSGNRALEQKHTTFATDVSEIGLLTSWD